MIPFIFGTDLHGIEQHKPTVAAFKTFVTDNSDPKALRVFGGDLWNFAALRRQAAEYEKSIRLNEDFLAGIEFLDWYRPSILILGNHDQRLWDAVKQERVKHSGYRAELAQKYVEQFEAFAKKLNIRVLPYTKSGGVARVNGMAFAHGFGGGENMTSKMIEAYGNVIFGHGHRFESLPGVRENRPVRGNQIGCMCRTDMDYSRADLGALKQENGWGYGFLNKTEGHTVYAAPVIKGKALTAGDFTWQSSKTAVRSASPSPSRD